MIEPIIIGIVLCLLICAAIRAADPKWISESWKNMLYIVALALLVWWIGNKAGWI